MDNFIKELNEYININKKIIRCKLGEIRLLDQIGQGGNAIVYSAKLGEHTVAIKFLYNYNLNKLERFKAEYINLAINQECLHNIVKPIFYDELGSNNKIPYIIMHYYTKNLSKYREEIINVVLFTKLKRDIYKVITKPSL